MAIAEDASTPAVARLTRSTVAALSTASFTPPAGASFEMVLYGIEWGTSPGSITAPTVSSSAGGAWTNGPSIQAGNLSGWLGSYWRYNATAPGAHTVTVTRSQTGSADAMLAVRVLTGTATNVTGGATQNINVTSGTGTQQTFTPNDANSYIAIMAADNSSSTLTANGNTTQFDNFNDTSNGSVIASGRATSLTLAAGSGVSLGWTGASSGNMLWIAQEVPAGVVASLLPSPLFLSQAVKRAAYY